MWESTASTNQFTKSPTHPTNPPRVRVEHRTQRPQGPSFEAHARSREEEERAGRQAVRNVSHEHEYAGPDLFLGRVEEHELQADAESLRQVRDQRLQFV